MLIRVDLPAPFSPTSACTPPQPATKSIASFATTGPNRLLTPRIAIAGVPRVSGWPGARVAGDGFRAAGIEVFSTRSFTLSPRHPGTYDYLGISPSTPS